MPEKLVSPDILALNQAQEAVSFTLEAALRLIPGIRKQANQLREFADLFDRFCLDLERLADRPIELTKN